MPSKQGIWGYERFDFIKHLTAEDLGLRGQSPTLIVGELKPLSFELILEDSILFHEIVNDRLLMAIKSSGKSDYQEMERLYNVCYCNNRLSVILFDYNSIRFDRIFAPYEFNVCHNAYPQSSRVGLKSLQGESAALIPFCARSILSI